jgi:hypothetical protein
MDKAISEDSDGLMDRLAKLAKFCAVFEKDSFQFGKWCGGGQDASGTYQERYFQLSAGGKKFFEHCYAQGWIRQAFDWSEWSESAEFASLIARPENLEDASPDQLSKLLTLLFRQDRFDEGTLAHAHNTGLLLAILRRARGLAATAK